MDRDCGPLDISMISAEPYKGQRAAMVAGHDWIRAACGWASPVGRLGCGVRHRGLACGWL